MPFTATAVTLAAAGTEKVRELPMPPWVFGALAFGSFVLLLGVLWLFRNTAAKHDTPTGAGHGDPRTAGAQSATDSGAHH